MKKIFLFLFFLVIYFLGEREIFATWWERPTERPTPPNLERDRISPPFPSPTQGGETVTPTQALFPTNFPAVTPSITPLPSQIPGGGSPGTTSEEDPCAPGKPYFGPYCGWSPRIGGVEGGKSEERFVSAKPPVLGLSATGAEDLSLSDIMLFTGILCFGLYLRSKINVGRFLKKD